jgi:hypothetical protein
VVAYHRTALHPYNCCIGSISIMQPSRARMGPPKYAPHPNHPIHIHPVRPLYRFMATGLGASMWFFVRAKCVASERQD